MDISQENLWIAYGSSNAVGLIFLLIAWRAPKAARWLFFALFAWACWINWSLAVKTPQVYLDYADHALPIYRSFILGFFSEHITWIVAAIATGQGFIALGMLGRDWMVRGAAAGAIVFLLAIAPLGLYAAFPFSLTVAWAAWLVMRHPRQQPLVSRRKGQVTPS